MESISIEIKPVKAEAEATRLDELPFDAFLHILEHLGYKDLNMLAQVNRRLYTITNDNLLWKLKLIKDIKHWRMLDSNTYPKQLFKARQINNDGPNSELDDQIIYKKLYMNACPDLITKKDILKKLETFQQVQNDLHLTSTSDNTTALVSGMSTISNCNNITLSSLSSLVMPMAVFGQIKDFFYRNLFNNQSLGDIQHDLDSVPKLVMFGPGLETTTSCLVTNILWKSEFKTIGMIPGRDGYGSGIKLKLFNHRPFNLTILYTNVSKVRASNTNHDSNLNRLIVAKAASDNENINNEYELHPQVKETCANASGFIYVVDNKHLASLEAAMVSDGVPPAGNIHNLSPIDNYKLELNVLMKEVSADLPLLILGCNADMKQASVSSDLGCMKLTAGGSRFVEGDGLSCTQIIEKLDLFDLTQEWQIRNCNLFQHKLKDIVLGFEWILNKLDQKILLEKYNALNSEAE